MNEYPDYAFPKLSKIRIPPGKRRFAFVVSRNPDPLEFIGPLNALRMANFVFENSGRTDIGYDMELVASEPGIIYDVHGLTMQVDKPFHKLDDEVESVLVSPMNWEDLFDRTDGFLAWLRERQYKVQRIGSICSAAYVLAEAGILNGRRATTHWDLIPDLQARYPEIIVDGKPIYVKDGNVYTAAGMTSGVDMTIAIIEEDFGREVALRVAQAMVLFLKRPGNQAQFGVELAARLPDSTAMAEIQNYISDNIHGDLRVDILAKRTNMSPRNFSRVFAGETGVSPGRFVERQRLEAARRHIEDTKKPMSDVAIRCGYGSVDAMRIAFERSLGVGPRAYRERFSTANVN